MPTFRSRPPPQHAIFTRMVAPSSRRRLDEPFATVLNLYEQGQCLAAWEAGRGEGPLQSWPAIEPRLLAGRLAPRLGAPRLGSLLHLRAFRRYPDHSEAQYYYVWHVFQRWGAFAAWQERKRLAPPRTDDADAVADYHGQCAQLLGSLRDFPAAEAHVQLAFDAARDRPYWFVERANLYEFEDRYQEALQSAEQGLSLNGRYPPAVASAAHYLQLLDRNDEAVDLLRHKAVETQSCDIVGQLIRVLLKLRLLDEADDAVARYAALTPLRERDHDHWLASTRAAIATYRGDYRSAMTYIEQVDHPYYGRIAANLRDVLGDAQRRALRRAELPVAFVRQHHLTCAPATLSAISRFWNKPAEHLSVAEEICYDGTPAHSERRWAQENEWGTREFRVDWDSATALIDRGIPFTLTLNDVIAGHLQAVIGYDEATGVLLVRDPMSPETVEINARDLLDYQRAAGPRGMAMVPVEHSRLLDGLTLPEAELYDLYHAMQLALERHDRERALELHRQMSAIAAGHRLTWTARRSLAGYDDNPHEALTAIDALLELFPDDQTLLLARLRNLRQVSSRDERLAWLKEVSHRPGRDPMLLIEYAVELSADDRRLEQAIWYVRRAMRQRRDEPYALYRLAGLYWRLDRQEEAIELHRFAACLDDPRAEYSQRYFEVCRWQRQIDTALVFLRNRFARLGARAGEPAMTLFGALEALDRTDEAFEALDTAVRSRPGDGGLRLFAASKCTQYGRFEEAQLHRAAAAGLVKPVAWLAETAREARLEGKRTQALEHWREIIRTQPLDLEAHRTIALLLSETSTRQEAVDHLRSSCETFPHHAGLHHLLYEWTAGDPAIERERVLRKLVEIDAADAWTQRELALNLLAQGRFPEALQLADESVVMDATSAASHAVKGHILHLLGRSPEAADCFREAITRSADASDAIYGLLDSCGDTVARRKEVLELVEARLLEQAVFGNGLLAFREAARGVLTPDELVGALRRAHARRPDLWHAWSALAQHLSEMGRTSEALEVARQATERFSKVPHVWLDLSRIHRTRLEVEERIAALHRCRDINAEWTEPILELCDAYEQAGRGEEGDRFLEAAIRRTPLVPSLRVRLASLLHHRGEHDRAIETLRETLRISPDYPEAWQALTEWSHARGQTSAALDLALAFAESRPGEPQPWVRLADLQLNANRPEAALETADRALQVNPRNIFVYDVKATALAALRRFWDAEAACHPSALGDRTPIALLGRAAWVDAQRGDLTSAIRRMQALLDANPDYRWGWSQLLDWCAHQGQVPQAMQAAERLAWLDPTNVVPLGWLGDLKRRLGDQQGAKAAFQRAMRLQPSYLFAGFQHLDIQCAEGDFEGAQRTLDILRPHAPAAQILSARVEVEVAQSNTESSLKLMRELCLHPEFESQALWQAAGAIAKGWGMQLERLLKQVLEGRAWHPATPALWANVRAARGRYASLRRYRWLVGLGAPGKEAIYEILTALGDRAKSNAGSDVLVSVRLSWHLFWIRMFCRGWRRTDDLYWGKMGYALLCLGGLRPLIGWMRDWRQRRSAQSWMLQNLAVALLLRRKDRDARAVLRHVARHFTPMEAVDPHLKLWCVISACLDDDLSLADRLLHETPEDVVRESERALRDFGLMLVALLRDAPGRASLTREGKALIQRATAVRATDGVSARLLTLAQYKIARHVRDPRMTIAAWVHVHPWIWVVLAVVGIGLLIVVSANQ